MHGSVIFHSPCNLQASAVVRGWWNRSPVELLIESGAVGGFGNDIHDACAEFIGWCLSQSPRPGSLSVQSLPGLPWNDTDHDPWAWYDRLMAEIAGWDPVPILVDLDDFLITHRGAILWPPPERRRERQTDRRARPPGALFPIGWFGQDLGGLRAGSATYNCYPPEELPPIRMELTGTFDWLRSAPERNPSIAPDPLRTATTLDRLLSSTPVALPDEFVAFFQSPELWYRIRSCTNCYLHLDEAVVEVRGGLGWLVRFLSDSQGCKTWHLWLPPTGSQHTVVATYHYTGSENAHLKNGLPHPKDITTCAGSFEEFIYRFWLENELWYALHDPGALPEGGEEYLTFYRSKSQIPGRNSG